MVEAARQEERHADRRHAAYDDATSSPNPARRNPERTVYEDEHASPSTTSAPPRRSTSSSSPRAYVSWDDFSAAGSASEIAGFVRAVGHVAREQGLVAPGYRLLANVGARRPGSAAPPRPPVRRRAARADAGESARLALCGAEITG
jgi:hypothetical protein